MFIFWLYLPITLANSQQPTANSQQPTANSQWLWVGFICIVLTELLCFILYLYVSKTGKGASFVFNAGVPFYPSVQYHPLLGQYDSTLFYTLKQGKGDIQGFGYHNQYNINSLGVRDDENSLNKPDIIILGDSHSMGLGVEQEETYANLLEKKTQFKVLNTGITSYGTARQLQMLKRTDMSECKLIILQYCENDYLENKEFYYNKNIHKSSSKQAYYNLQRLYSLSLSYYPFKYIQLFTQKYSSRFRLFIQQQLLPLPSKIASSSPLFNNLLPETAFINVLREIRKVTSVPILVFCISDAQQYESFPLYDSIEKSIQESDLKDVYCHNSLKGFTQQDHFRGDPHPNRQGHIKIANNIESFFKTHIH